MNVMQLTVSILSPFVFAISIIICKITKTNTKFNGCFATASRFPTDSVIFMSEFAMFIQSQLFVYQSKAAEFRLMPCQTILRLSYKIKEKIPKKERHRQSMRRQLLKDLSIINHRTNYIFTVAQTTYPNTTIAIIIWAKLTPDRSHAQMNAKRVKCKIHNNYRFYAWNAEKLFCCWQNVMPKNWWQS